MRYRYRPRKRRIKVDFRLLSLLLGLGLLAAIAYITFPVKTVETVEGVSSLLVPELSTNGFSKVETIDVGIVGDMGVVSLKSGCYELVANVEPMQAYSLQLGKEGKFAERPNAHDIAAEVFKNLGIEVLMVKITELRGNAFYAKLFLKQGDKILSIDARPSDAMAIALRMNATIYINSTLLEEVGKKIC